MHRFNYVYKRGTKAKYVAEHTEDRKIWVKIVVGVLTDAQRKWGYKWVEREYVDVGVVEPCDDRGVGEEGVSVRRRLPKGGSSRGSTGSRMRALMLLTQTLEW